MSSGNKWSDVGDLASENIIDSSDMEAAIDELEAIEEAHKEWVEGDADDRGDEPGKLDDDQTALLAVLRETRDCCGREWRRGVAFIRESYWQRYAEEMADVTGAVPKDAAWPMTCIDWEEAAAQLAQDYSQCEINGTTFYFRD